MRVWRYQPARDLGDFTAYPPLLDAAYLASFKTKIDVVSELIRPKSETVELKVLTDRISRPNQQYELSRRRQ